jgi:hypothetical protein
MKKRSIIIIGCTESKKILEQSGFVVVEASESYLCGFGHTLAEYFQLNVTKICV